MHACKCTCAHDDVRMNRYSSLGESGMMDCCFCVDVLWGLQGGHGVIEGVLDVHRSVREA